jgi:hypothetical protein
MIPALWDDPISNFDRTRILRCVSERTDGMKTIDSLIDSLYRVATAPMTDRQLEIIENKLLNLANENDAEAVRQYADLYLCRMKWERTRSAEDRQDFVNQAHEAKAWLAVNSL